MLKLNTIRDNPGARTSRKRVGRGLGSGLGKTSGKGQKGQKARTGVAVRAFEGGQMPLHRRLPKRGFKSHNTEVVGVVNVGQLQALVDAGLLDVSKPITVEVLTEAGLVKKSASSVKLLAKGQLKAKLDLHVHAASESAKKITQAAGGSVTLLG